MPRLSWLRAGVCPIAIAVWQMKAKPPGATPAPGAPEPSLAGGYRLRNMLGAQSRRVPRLSWSRAGVCPIAIAVWRMKAKPTGAKPAPGAPEPSLAGRFRLRKMLGAQSRRVLRLLALRADGFAFFASEVDSLESVQARVPVLPKTEPPGSRRNQPRDSCVAPPFRAAACRAEVEKMAG